MAVGESAEVRRERWLRGEWGVVTDRLVSREWVRSKLPATMTGWYLAGIMAVAVVQLAAEGVRYVVARWPRKKPKTIRFGREV